MKVLLLRDQISDIDKVMYHAGEIDVPDKVAAEFATRKALGTLPTPGIAVSLPNQPAAALTNAANPINKDVTN